jgi:zinc protease
MIQEARIISQISSGILPNGFRIIYAPNHAHPVVSLQVFIRMGSCWEKEDEAGYSHLLEHLVFRSTVRYPDNQLSVRASFLGSNINAYTEFDSTCYYLTLSSDFAREGIEILSELVRKADFSEAEFIYEKGVVLEELKQYQNDPEDFFLEEIPNLYFRESPFKKPIIGNKDTLRQATPERLRGFYRRYYTPENSYLIVSGAFEKSKLEQDIADYFGNWKSGKETRKAANQRKNSSETTVTELRAATALPTVYPSQFIVSSLKKNISKPMLGFVLPELSDKKPDSHVLGLLTRIFAVGKKSRLYRRLFVKEKIVDQIRVESFTGINDGISVILVIPKHHSFLEKIIDIFLEEFNRIRHFGFSVDEFNEVKTEMLHAHRYSFEYMQYLGMSIGNEELLGDYTRFINYPGIIKKITEKSMHRIVKNYYNFSQLGIFQYGKNLVPEEEIKLKVESLQTKRIENGRIKSDFYQTTLSSGTKVMLKRVLGKPTIGITAAFPVSQLNEVPSNRGINLLTSILLLYGNDKNTYDQLLEFCSRHGIQIDISSQEEATLVKIKCFSEMFSTSLELIADILGSPHFPAEHFHNIQRTLLSNLERLKDFPSIYATHLWKKQIFGKESNLLEKEGTKTTLRKITRKRTVNWYYDYYDWAKMTLTVTGDFDFEDCIFHCERVFRERAKRFSLRGNPLNFQKAVISPGKRFKKNFHPDNQQGIIHVGGFGCSSREISKNTAFYLLAQIIGGDMNSRLNNELREKRGWAYAAGFDFISLKETGVFVANALVDKEKCRESYQIIIETLAEIRENGVTEEELEIAKNTVRGQRLRAEESVLGQSSVLALLDILGYDYDFYLQREERLQKVKADDLRNIAREYFQEDALYSHILE